MQTHAPTKEEILTLVKQAVERAVEQSNWFGDVEIKIPFCNSRAQDVQIRLNEKFDPRRI